MAFAILGVALLWLQQHLLDLAALAQHGVDLHGRSGGILGPSFYLGLPYPVIDPEFGPPRSIQLALIAIAACESAALYGMYRSLRARAVAGWEGAALAVAALVMTAIALGAHSMLGFDLYAYAGYAKLGVAAAFAPPAVPFPGDFRAINDVWGKPMVPSLYGPLWVALAALFAGGAKSLASGLFALRLLALIPFAVIAAVVWRTRGVASAALIALNPALYVLYVANAHNDLLAVAPLLIAIALAATLPLAAAVLAAAAGLMKVSFSICVLLVFAGRGGLARRTAWAALSIALIAGGSFLFGGAPYGHALLARAHEVHGAGSLGAQTAGALKVALFVLAALAVLVAFVRGTVWRSAAWSLIASSSTVYPWYIAGGIPYAALERDALAAYLVLVPVTAALLDISFPHAGFGQVAMLVMLLAAAYEIVRKKQRPIDV